MSVLEVDEFATGYKDVAIVKDISVDVDRNEKVGLIGPNGAGKSTLFKGIMGYLDAWNGSIHFQSDDITGLRPSTIVNKGIGYIPQVDNTFPKMTVKENIQMGAYGMDDVDLIEQREQELYELFPTLRERRDQRVMTMSGGEKKMVAIARAIITNPELILFDEPSAGLMPKYIDDIFMKIDMVQEERDTSFLMIEQNIKKLLEYTDRAYVLREGKIHLERGSTELLESPDLHRAYLGGSSQEAT